jgi:hypothetical protein
VDVLAWLPGVLVALIGIVPGVLVWRQAAQAREDTEDAQRAAEGVERRRVDQEAYTVAEAIWRAGMAEAERQAVQAREQVLLREREIGRLQRRVDALEVALRTAGVPVPAEES